MPTDIERRPSRPPPPPSWSSIPNKFQLALICSVRIVDFFQQAALQTYMFYQLRSFSPDAPDTEISFQSGVFQGVFTLAQVFTGILWGRVADSPSFGRKKVLIIGLAGQGLSCMGVAFSNSFVSAAVWRCLGGAVNATVGGARTALAESTEKKFHSRTFLLLPLAWNIANIFGPIFGGLFSDPVLHYPGLFGDDSTFGGQQGVSWLKKYPYAPPNLMCAMVLFGDALLIWLGLRETLVSIKFNRDRGIEIAENIRYQISRVLFARFGYSHLDQGASQLGPDTMDDTEEPASTPMRSLPSKEEFDKYSKPGTPSKTAPKAPPIYKAFTLNVFMVLMTVAFMDFQMGGFAALWSIFLSSSPRTREENAQIQLPFHFAGGTGFSPATVGIAMSVLGFVGIGCQLLLYPSVNARFGLLKSTQFSLFIFPVAYTLAPYLSLLTQIPIMLWFGIFIVVLLQIGARTFAIPGVVLLTNNACPSPQLLGTIHGMGAATSSAFRTIGPIAAGHWYSQGIDKGMVGLAWWLLAIISMLGVIPAFWARDGR